MTPADLDKILENVDDLSSYVLGLGQDGNKIYEVPVLLDPEDILQLKQSDHEIQWYVTNHPKCGRYRNLVIYNKEKFLTKI